MTVVLKSEIKLNDIASARVTPMNASESRPSKRTTVQSNDDSHMVFSRLYASVPPCIPVDSEPNPTSTVAVVAKFWALW